MKREERLTKPQQYSNVYGKGSSWTTRFLVMRALPNDLTVSRHGFSISKRVGNAVIRNKIKRRLKEIIRSEPVKQGWDIVYIVRKPAAEADFATLKETAERLLIRAELLKSEEQSVSGN
jgi:ribonuclease P protein component